MEEQKELQVCEVLQLVVQHCGSHTPQQVCTLLQVSSKVNAALKQCRGRCYILIELTPPPYERETDNSRFAIRKPWAFARFAAWLPNHAGLVKTMMVLQDKMNMDKLGRNPDINLINEPCYQLLEMALQQSTSALPAGAAAAAAAGSAVTTAQPLQLQLQCFVSNHCLSQGAVTALAAARVKDVMTPYREPRIASSSHCATFAELTDLLRLDLLSPGAGQSTGPAWVPEQLIAALAQLPQLTSLRCEGLETSSASHLPVGLRELTARWSNPFNGSLHSSSRSSRASGVRPFVGDTWKMVDLTHMTALQELCWACNSPDCLTALLPAQLTLLRTEERLELHGGVKLGHLCVDCRYGNNADGLGVMQHLCHLTNLQHLVVKVSSTAAKQLPRSALRAAVAALGRLSNLTALKFAFGAEQGRNDDDDYLLDYEEESDPKARLSEVPLCASLRYLLNLRKFELSTGWTDDHSNAQDLLNLTVLTQLSELKLSTPGLNDTVAVALLSSLTSLQHLQLTSNKVRTSAFLPVLAGLTNLTYLWLTDEQRASASGAGADAERATPFGWEPHELMLLSRLTKLQRLCIFNASALARDSMNELIRVLPGVSPVL